MKNLLLLMMLIVLGPAANAEATGWILTTDFSTFGRVRSFDLDDPWTVSGDLAVIPGDPAGRHHDGRVYVVGRHGANLIQIYDPEAGFALVREFGIGAGRNPQDIAFDSAGEAYVSCYDEAVLLRVDVEVGTVLETYDTSGFADDDGLPETAWMIARGDLLYITCQKLDRSNWYSPTGPGALLVFDMAAETWVDMDEVAPGIQPIDLIGGNPYTRIEAVANGSGGENLRVGCRVVEGDREVVARADHRSIQDHNGAHRYLAGLAGPGGLLEGEVHERLVLLTFGLVHRGTYDFRHQQGLSPEQLDLPATISICEQGYCSPRLFLVQRRPAIFGCGTVRTPQITGASDG